MNKAYFQSAFEKIFWNFSLEDPSREINGHTVAEILGGSGKTASGQDVTEDTALTLSAVWACVNAFSAPFSYFPVNLYERTGNGRKKVLKHQVLDAINQPLPYMTRNVMLERAMVHVKLWGNAYIEPIRNKSRNRDLKGFFLHHPATVEVKASGVGPKQTISYHIQPPHNKGEKPHDVRVILPEDILHIPGMGDSVVGKSIIKYAREDIGLEMATREYGGEFFANGGRTTGILSFNQMLDDAQRDQAKEAHTKARQKGGDLVLGADAKYTPVSIPPEDAQFLGTRYFNVTTIARWFGVPPYKIAALEDGATFTNIEATGIAFLKDAMAPIVEKFESEFNTKLFGVDSDLKLEFDMEAYLRADSIARAEQDRTRIQNGLKTPNELRGNNGDNPLEGGNELLIQSNMILLKDIKKLGGGQKPKE